MTDEQAERLEQKLDKILEVLPAIEALGDLVVVQQKDAAEIAGITDDTIRNRVKRGEVDVLQRDGSRLNYLTLKTAGELKKRNRRTRTSLTK